MLKYWSVRQKHSRLLPAGDSFGQGTEGQSRFHLFHSGLRQQRHGGLLIVPHFSPFPYLERLLFSAKARYLAPAQKWVRKTCVTISAKMNVTKWPKQSQLLTHTSLLSWLLYQYNVRDGCVLLPPGGKKPSAKA